METPTYVPRPIAPGGALRDAQAVWAWLGSRGPLLLAALAGTAVFVLPPLAMTFWLAMAGPTHPLTRASFLLLLHCTALSWLACQLLHVRVALRVARREPLDPSDLTPGPTFAPALVACLALAGVQHATITQLWVHQATPGRWEPVAGFLAAGAVLRALELLAAAYALDRDLPPLAALREAGRFLLRRGLGLLAALSVQLVPLALGTALVVAWAAPIVERNTWQAFGLVAVVVLVWTAAASVVLGLTAAARFVRGSEELLRPAAGPALLLVPPRAPPPMWPSLAVLLATIPLLIGADALAWDDDLHVSELLGPGVPDILGVSANLVPVALAAALLWRAEARGRGVIVDGEGLLLGPWTERWPGTRIAWADLLGWRVVADGVRLHLRGRPERLGPVVHADEAEVLALVAALERGKG